MSLALPFNIHADTALFRLPGRVFFTSDVEESQKSLKVLSCLEGPSFLNILTNFKVFKDGLSLNDKIQKLEEEKIKTILLPFVYLEKVKLASINRGRDHLSETQLTKLGKKCQKITWEQLSNQERSKLMSEFYLRERFQAPKGFKQKLAEYLNSLNLKDPHEFFSFRSKKFIKNN